MPNRKQISNVHLAFHGQGPMAKSDIKARKWASHSAGETSTKLFSGAASSTYQVTDSIDISTAGKVHLLVRITNTAIADVVSFIPEVCGTLDEDTFFPLAEAGAAAVANAGAAPQGDINANEFSSRVVRPIEYKTDSIINALDKLGFWFTIEVPFGRALRVQVRADAGTPTVEIIAALST